MMLDPLAQGRKTLLVVLFIPSVERETPEDINDGGKQAELGRFCRKMGRDTNQGEIGIVIADEYFAITEFSEDS